MQRRLTKEQGERRVRRNQFIIGILLIGLMIFSTLGYALTGDDEKTEEKEYGGIKFIQDSSGYWIFNIQNYEFMTKYNPQEVEDINFLNTITLQDYMNKPLYFVGEFQEPIYELSRNFNNFVLRFNNACLDENCSMAYPVKNCSEDNVIIIQEIDYEKDRENILIDENCVFIKANEVNQTKYADAYLFKLLGIK